jgi:hypothetical protein
MYKFGEESMVNTSTKYPSNTDNAYGRRVYSSRTTVERSDYMKKYALSVRCLKN